MQKFLFSLQPVLKVKKIKVKEAQRELGLALNLLSDEKAKLDKIIEKEKQSLQNIERSKSERFDPAKISQYYRSLDGVRKERAEQERYLITLAQMVKEKRSQLKKLSNEKKMFEELEKKENKEYLRESNRMEQKYFDDMSAIKRTQNREK